MAFSLKGLTDSVTRVIKGKIKQESIDQLIRLLEEINGSLYFEKVKYIPEEFKLAIVYGCGCGSDIVEEKNVGKDIYFYKLDPEKFKNLGNMTDLDLGERTVKVPKILEATVSEIIKKTKKHLDEKIRSMLSPPKGSLFKIQSCTSPTPLGPKKEKAEYLLKLMIKGNKFQYKVTPADILALGTREYYYFITVDYLRFLGAHPLSASQSKWKALKLESNRSFGNMFLLQLKKIKLLEIISISESELKKQIENMVSQFFRRTQKDNNGLKLERGVIFGEDTSNAHFFMKKLQLSVFAFALFEEPQLVPLPLITWILQEYAKDEFKKYIEVMNDVYPFLGEEKAFIQTLIDQKSLKETIKNINTGVDNSIEKTIKKNKEVLAPIFESIKSSLMVKKVEPKVDEDDSIQTNFEQKILTEEIPQKEEFVQKEVEDSEESIGSLNAQGVQFDEEIEAEDPGFDTQDAFNAMDEISKIQQLVQDEEPPEEPQEKAEEPSIAVEFESREKILEKAEQVEKESEAGLDSLLDVIDQRSESSARIRLFPDVEEKMKLIQLKDFSKELSLQYIIIKDDKKLFKPHVIKKIGEMILAFILDLVEKQIIESSNDFVWLKRGFHDDFKGSYKKDVYELMFDWDKFQEKTYRKIWSIPDIKFKKFNNNEEIQLMQELKLKSQEDLDDDFDNGHFYQRYFNKEVVTFLAEENQFGLKNQYLQKLDSVLGKQSHLKAFINWIFDFLSGKYWDFKSEFIIPCDVFKVLDFVSEMVYYYSARNGVTGLSKESVKKLYEMFKNMEKQGLIKRKIYNGKLNTVILKTKNTMIPNDQKLLIESLYSIKNRYFAS